MFCFGLPKRMFTFENTTETISWWIKGTLCTIVQWTKKINYLFHHVVIFYRVDPSAEARQGPRFSIIMAIGIFCSDNVQLNQYSLILRRQSSLVEAPLQMFPWKRKPRCQNEIGHEHHSVTLKIYYLKSASQYSRNFMTKTWCLFCISMHCGLRNKDDPWIKRCKKLAKVNLCFSSKNILNSNLLCFLSRSYPIFTTEKK